MTVCKEVRVTFRFRTPFGLLLHPLAACARLGEAVPTPRAVLFQHLVWLALLPPACAFVGAANFGWRLGAEQPLVLDAGQLALVSVGYFCALFGGFVGAAVASRWMAPTYGATADWGAHLGLVAVVAAPLAGGAVAHLFPHVFLNLLVLIPALIWSMYLLYTGLPMALGTSVPRGMLMASSLIGFLLVAAVTLLGVTVALWAAGVGPLLGV